MNTCALGILMLAANSTQAQMPQSFETARFCVEKATNDHRNYLEQILNNPQVQAVYNTTTVEIFTNVAAQLEIINKQWEKYGYGLYIIFDKETSEFIGFSGFHSSIIDENKTVDVLSEKDRSELELYGFFMPQYWRKGYGYEVGKELINQAFAHLPHSSIIAFAEPKNVASIQILKKFNFQEEPHVSYNNELHSVYRLNKP